MLRSQGETTCLIIPWLKPEADSENKLAGYQVLQLPVILVHDRQLALPAAIKKNNANWLVVPFKKWRGKGAAIVKGLQVAKEKGYTMALTVDCNERVKPSELTRIIQKSYLTKTITIGCRRADKFQQHPDKRRLHHFSNLLFWLETGRSCPDTRSSIRLYPINLINQVRTDFHRRAWEMEILVRAVWSGIKIKSIELDSYQVTDEPSPVRKINDYLRIIGIHGFLILRRLWFWPFKQLVEHAPINWPTSWRGKIALAGKRFFWKSHQKPGEAGWAVAMGLFSGCLPVIGIQSLLAVYFAQRLHLNKLLVLFASLISLTPIMPLILYLELLIGHLVLAGTTKIGQPIRSISWPIIRSSMAELLTGGVVVALLAALVGGLITSGIISYLRQRKLSKILNQRRPGHAIRPKKKSPYWNWLLIVGAVVFLTALFIHYGIAIWLSAPLPAKVQSVKLIGNHDRLEKNKRQRLREHSYFERQGVKACYLEGSSQEQGLIQAVVCRDASEQIKQFLQQTHFIYPKHPIQRYVHERLLWMKNKDWARYMTVTEQQALAAMADRTTTFPDLKVMRYNRLVSWQTLYDRRPSYIPEAGAVGTALGSKSRQSGRPQLLMGHNFDCHLANKLDKHKTVFMVKPDDGYRYLSVGYPGLLGVITGINEKTIAIAVVPAFTLETPQLGYPALLLAKQVLQQAASLDEAIALLEAQHLPGAESFLLGSGREEKMIVVEKNKSQTIIRTMQNNFLLVVNHFQSPALSKEQAETPLVTNSRARLRRLKELAFLNRKTMTVVQLAKILRDRRGMYGRELGIGHAWAINRLGTVHSAMIDLKKKIIWVAAAPFHLGAYVPFALDDFDQSNQEQLIPPDAMLLSGAYQSYEVYQVGLSQARRLMQRGAYQEALAWIQEIQPLNARDYQLYLLAAKSLEKIGRLDAAVYNYRQAKAYVPSTTREREMIDEKIQKLKK